MVLRSNIAFVASLSLLGAFFSAHTFSQESSSADQSLEEMVVVANRIETPMRQVGSTVSVLTEQDLIKHQTNLLADRLRSVPGVQVSQNGGLGSATSVRLRGEEAHRTLLLIDGINMSDASRTQISPRFEDLLSNHIARVEVLRGPQGMIYGADAGGVISLTSKTTEEEFEADVNVEAGRFSTQTLSANGRGKVGVLKYSLTATDLSSDGFNSREADENGEADGYDNRTLHGRFDVALGERNDLELVVRDVDGEAEFDGCGWPSSMNCLADSQQRAYRAALNTDLGVYKQSVAYSQNTTNRVNTLLDSGAMNLDSRGELSQLQYVGQVKANEQVNVVFGLDAKVEYFLNKQTDIELERDNTGLFADVQFSLGDNVFYTLGARLDDNEDFGQHTSFRATGAYLIPASVGELKLKGSYGTGFRAPSLYEINYNNSQDPASGAPTNLKEESSRGLDVGLEWYITEKTYVEAVVFTTEINDEIYFDLAGFCCYLQDDGKTKSSGLELSGNIELSTHVLLGANYTFNKTSLSDSTTLSGAKGGDSRARRPKHIFNASLETFWLEDQLKLAVFLRNIRDAVDYPYGSTEPVQLDDHQVLDISARWQFNQAVEAYLRGTNVLDEQYQEIGGYHSAGAAAYAGVRLSF